MPDQNSPPAATRWTLLIASSLTVMAGAIITTALPIMQKHFAEVPHVAVWVRLVLTMPALFIVLGAPIAGFIVDRFGRKPLLLAGLVLYGVAGTAGYFLESLTHILISRAVLGIAVAGIMTSVTTLLADYFAGAERGKVLGQQAAFMGLGGTVYTSFGGVLADMNWRYPFLIYLTSFLVLPLALTTLREPRHESAKLPVETGRVEARTSAHQLLPLGALASIYGTVWLMQVIFYLIPVQMPFYLQSEFTTSGTLVGVAIGLGTLSYSIGSLLSPRVSDRMPRTTLIPLSFGLIAVGYGIVGFAPSYLIVIVGLVIGGQGFGYIIPQMSVWLTTIVPVHLRGRALGVQTTFVFLGHFLSPILAQPIIQAQGFRGAYNSGALLLICLAGVVVVANLLRPRSNAS